LESCQQNLYFLVYTIPTIAFTWKTLPFGWMLLPSARAPF